jgi:hypothetical protein
MAFSAAFALLLGMAIICRVQARKIGGGGGGGGGGRGGGGGSAKDKLRPFLLWLALILFAGAGTLAPGTFVGDIIGGIAKMGAWVTWLLAFGMIVAIVRDLWHDQEPDKAAPFALFLLPALTAHLGGTIGSTLQDFWSTYNGIITDALGKLTGI